MRGNILWKVSWDTKKMLNRYNWLLRLRKKCIKHNWKFGEHHKQATHLSAIIWNSTQLKVNVTAFPISPQNKGPVSRKMRPRRSNKTKCWTSDGRSTMCLAMWHSRNNVITIWQLFTHKTILLWKGNEWENQEKPGVLFCYSEEELLNSCWFYTEHTEWEGMT